MARFQVIGISDEVLACDCCGKTNLKRTVVIQDNETSEVKYFGTTCAAAPAKGFDLVKEIKEAVRANDAERAFVCRSTHIKYRKAGGTYAPADAAGVFKMLDRPLFDRLFAETLTATRSNTALLQAA